MASISSRTPFICHSCIRRLQPWTPRNQTVFPSKFLAAPPSSSQTQKRTLRIRRHVVNRDGTHTLRIKRHLVNYDRTPSEPLIPSAPSAAVTSTPSRTPSGLKPSTRSQPPRRKAAPRTPSPTKQVPKTPPTPTDTKPTSSLSLPSQTSDFNWYWETLAPSLSQKTAASAWFTQKARPQFLRSVSLFRTFPESDVPEIAFVGRSNVGKSSLLNALVNADIKSLLARTSAQPGCTRTLNLYGVGPGDGVRVRKGKNNGHDRIVGIGGVLIVDLPGYGEGSLSEWGTEIMKYLTQRKQLRRVFVLVDASAAGLKEKDRSILASLRLAGVPHQVVLSKIDKVFLPSEGKLRRVDGRGMGKDVKSRWSLNELRLKMAEIKSEIQPRVGGGALGELLGVSAEVMVNGRRLGIDAMRVAVLQAAGVQYETRKKGKVQTVKTNVDVKQPEDLIRNANRPY